MIAQRCSIESRGPSRCRVRTEFQPPFSVKKELETQSPALVLEAFSGLPTPPLHIQKKHGGLNVVKAPIAELGFQNRAGELSEGAPSPVAAGSWADACSFQELRPSAGLAITRT